MSSAIDFDFQAIRMQSGAAPFHTNAAKERLIGPANKDDYREQRAYQSSAGDQPYKPENTGCCGFLKSQGPSARIIELNKLFAVGCVLTRDICCSGSSFD